jgi:hypothetical protein
MKDFLIRKVVGILIFSMDQCIRDWNLNIIVTREKMSDPIVIKGDQPLLSPPQSPHSLPQFFPSSPYQIRNLKNTRRVKNVADIESF